jgi:NADPH:quinone reductase-like Zn-dependent oxidoreductase
MKAVVRDTYGSTDVVRIEDVPQPVPDGDQVLVRVHAASVNRADLDALGPRPAFSRLFLGVRRPRSHGLGLDVAGVIEAVGPAVTRFRPGDRVFADLFTFSVGTFAEYACAPERAFQVIPDHLSFEDASTLPHAGTLAMQGLRMRNGRTIKTGDKVLVDGASGSVGPFAVQIAKSMGAEVTGVTSTAKVDLVQSLGADHVIDYTKVDYTKTGERYDWIVDTDSHHTIRSVRRALRPNGVYLTLGGDSGDIFGSLVLGLLASLGSDRWSGLMLWWKPFNPDDMARLTQLIAEGKVKPVIERTYSLDEAVEALRHVEAGRARGKVVITMQDATPEDSPAPKS